MQAIQWVYEHGDPDGLPNDLRLLHTCFGPDALRRSTLIADADEFRAVHGETPLTLIPGFCPWRIYPDVMHLVHLAVMPDVIVSCLCDLSDGASREHDLANLWQSYKAWCDEQGLSFKFQKNEP